MTNRVKVAVTGAAGQIGYALLFRIASGEMFGKNTEIDLNLIEVEPALNVLNGVKMELDDCAFPLLKNIFCTADINQGFKDVDWAILVGSAPRKAGMERSDLLKINGGIFTAQGKALNAHAKPTTKVFVVGNPCNTNCLIAMNNAPNIPKENFFAMTMLDENRARAQLAQKANVDVTQVAMMNIYGNHSATQYPDYYNATISGRPAVDVIKDEQWLQNTFVPAVQKRGAAVIEARGASSAASAANGVVDSVRHLTTDTPAGESFSVCLCSNGQMGVDEGLIFSFPCRVEKGRLKVITNRSHHSFGQDKIAITLDELRAERDAVKDLGLI